MAATTVELNGIDTAALEGMIREVGQNPRAGSTKFEVATRWMGGTAMATRVDAWELAGERRPRGFAIHADEPPELCGRGTAPNPQELLMAALNSCMMVGYVALSSLMGIELEHLEIRTEGEIDLRGFLGIDRSVKPGYDEVRYKVIIKGGGTPEQFEQIHRTVMATSPNYFNLASPVRLKPELVVE